jgi:hypothetical protein
LEPCEKFWMRVFFCASKIFRSSHNSAHMDRIYLELFLWGSL